MKKKYLIILTIILIVVLFSLFKERQPNTNTSSTSLSYEHVHAQDTDEITLYKGIITEVGANYIYTRLPNETDSSMSFSICECTQVIIANQKSSPQNLLIGYEVQITYKGSILETYPGKVTNVLEIKVK